MPTKRRSYLQRHPLFAKLLLTSALAACIWAAIGICVPVLENYRRDFALNHGKTVIVTAHVIGNDISKLQGRYGGSNYTTYSLQYRFTYRANGPSPGRQQIFTAEVAVPPGIYRRAIVRGTVPVYFLKYNPSVSDVVGAGTSFWAAAGETALFVGAVIGIGYLTQLAYRERLPRFRS